MLLEKVGSLPKLGRRIMVLTLMCGVPANFVRGEDEKTASKGDEQRVEATVENGIIKIRINEGKEIVILIPTAESTKLGDSDVTSVPDKQVNSWPTSPL